METNDNLKDFERFMKKRLEASTAFVEGEFGPLKQISVTQDPATIFGQKATAFRVRATSTQQMRRVPLHLHRLQKTILR